METIDVFDRLEEGPAQPVSTSRGKRWSGCILASFDGLRAAAGGSAQVFVWPDEGRFLSTGNWRFHAGRTWLEPLLIDAISASLMVATHDALADPKNREKFEAWTAKSRGHFAQLLKIAGGLRWALATSPRP